MLRRIVPGPLAILAVSSFLGSCATARDPELASLLEPGLAHGYPGVAMLIQEPGGRVRSAAVGYSDLERRVALRPDDAFHMASITKTFTAVAILQLVDQGRLSLDATLGGALGAAVARLPHAERITVRQVLDHSSGIYPTNNDMDYLTTVIGPLADPTRAWSAEQLLALADRDRSQPAGLPGAGHFYSDTNYVLLGMIVELVTGLPLKEHVRKSLLAPLGMCSTYYYSDYLGAQARPPIRTVRGYLLATDELRSAIAINSMFRPVPDIERPGGELLDTTLAAERIDAAAGLVTTLPDLRKFASALFGGKLLSPASQKLALAAGEGMAGEPLDKGRIWLLQAMRKSYGVLLYKEGDGPGGVNTLMAFSPATGRIYLGFINVFGYFDEIDFLMNDVIGKWESAATVPAKN